MYYSVLERKFINESVCGHRVIGHYGAEYEPEYEPWARKAS
jgi:hypothetical protein